MGLSPRGKVQGSWWRTRRKVLLGQEQMGLKRLYPLGVIWGDNDGIIIVITTTTVDQK